MTIFNEDEDWNDISEPLNPDGGNDFDQIVQSQTVQRRSFSHNQNHYKNKQMSKKVTRSRRSHIMNNVHFAGINQSRRAKSRGGGMSSSDEFSPLVLSDDFRSHGSENPFQQQKAQLFVNVPKRRSIRNMIQTQDPMSTINLKKEDIRSTMSLRNQDNMAQDLGHVFPIFSYGCFCCQCVRTQEVGIIEQFGNFQEIIYQPGCYCIAWPCTDISGRLSLRIQQLDVTCETKTKDNVFLHISVAVQYHVIIEKSYDAYYRLTDPRTQIESYVYDVVRSTVPKMELDEVFASKSEIALGVRTRLYKSMKDYGYSIIETLVVNISPDEKVKASMNAINASKRLKEAILHKAESAKIQRVKDAEAHCESLHLSGIGVSQERKAISKGLKTSANTLMSASDDIKPSDVMDILLLSQYFDMMSSIGGENLILSHQPGIVSDLKSYRV